MPLSHPTICPDAVSEQRANTDWDLKDSRHGSSSIIYPTHPSTSAYRLTIKELCSGFKALFSQSSLLKPTTCSWRRRPVTTEWNWFEVWLFVTDGRVHQGARLTEGELDCERPRKAQNCLGESSSPLPPHLTHPHLETGALREGTKGKLSLCCFEPRITWSKAGSFIH